MCLSKYEFVTEIWHHVTVGAGELCEMSLCLMLEPLVHQAGSQEGNKSVN